MGSQTRSHRKKKSYYLLLFASGLLAMGLLSGGVWVLYVSYPTGASSSGPPSPPQRVWTDGGAETESPQSDTLLPFDRNTCTLSTTPASLQADVETLLSFGTRVGGSQSVGYRTTQAFLRHQLRCLSETWLTEEVSHTDDTVLGKKTFTSFVATTLPGNLKCGNIVLAAHYDSKLFEAEVNFVGATDSAVPVIMLLHLARRISQRFSTSDEQAAMSMPKFTLMLFDGEEAYKQWSDTDSTYGSRMVASTWADQGLLRHITIFALLDLLGAKSPTFHPYDKTSLTWYNRMSSAERSVGVGGKNKYFPPRDRLVPGLAIEDDHVPFLRRGVPILHLIPEPFPSVWHKPTDDLTAIDWPTVEELQGIFEQFLVDAQLGWCAQKMKKKA